MEKRSRRRTRDLVTQPASQGLSENEIGCARISMMARSTNAPCKGRIQMRKTNPLHLLTFGLQRTAGPYRWVIRIVSAMSAMSPLYAHEPTSSARPDTSAKCKGRHKPLLCHSPAEQHDSSADRRRDDRCHYPAAERKQPADVIANECASDTNQCACDQSAGRSGELAGKPRRSSKPVE